MKEKVIKDKWEFEVIKNKGNGLKSYGWDIIIYKNDIKVIKQGAFGSITMAKYYARDYLLSDEFGIDKDDQN